MDRAGQNKTTTQTPGRSPLLVMAAAGVCWAFTPAAAIGAEPSASSSPPSTAPAQHEEGEAPDGVRTPEELRRESEPSRAVGPTQSSGTPGTIGGQGWGSAGVTPAGGAVTRPAGIALQFMAENTFVSEASGRLIIGGTGERYFVFDRDATGRRLAPVVLMPNLNLGALERLADRQDDGSRLLVSGQIYAYRGRNYMMISAPPVLERPATPPPPTPATTDGSSSATSPSAPATSAPATSGTPAGETPSTDNDPSIEAIIADLERHAGPTRQTDATPSTPSDHGAPNGGAAGAGGAEGAESALWASASSPVRPGQTLVMRRGRLVRGSAGAWRFALDAGPENLGETPLTVLPCLNLQAMESIAERQGEAGVFSISGPVHSYQGVNYLLPRLYRVESVSNNLTPVQ